MTMTVVSPLPERNRSVAAASTFSRVCSRDSAQARGCHAPKRASRVSSRRRSYSTPWRSRPSKALPVVRMENLPPGPDVMQRRADAGVPRLILPNV